MTQDRSYDHLVGTTGLPRLEARALLEQATGRPREFLVAHGGEPCPETDANRFDRLVAERRAGRPLAYLLGSREFRGRRFVVDPSVLIPRPETEELVDEALRCIAAIAAPCIVDLGTGSGVIAICLALERPDAKVVATDVSPAALAVAAANAAALGAVVDFRQGDWWQAVPVAGTGGGPEGEFDLVVSNPPYIAGADPHLAQGDLRHEPRAALTPGTIGTEAIERILEAAPRRLKRGGWLVVEHSHDQGPAVAARFARAGLEAIVTRRDLGGRDRITAGRRGPAPTTGMATVGSTPEGASGTRD